MRGKRRYLLMASLPVALGGLIAGGFWLEDRLGEAGERGPCVTDEKGTVECAGDPLPTPACNYDWDTGLPLPGSDPMCPGIPLCEGCPIPTFPRPTEDFGPFAPNPAAVLSSPPIHRVGDAPSLGRSDCPADWQALVSEATGMSVCFPKEAELLGPEPESGGYGWRYAGGPGGDRWEEAVWISLLEGEILIHRIGMSGGLFDLEKHERVSVQVSGFPAERYYVLNPGERSQDGFFYYVPRPEGVWELRLQVKIGPDYEPLSDEELVHARESLDAILNTVRLP